MFFMPDTMYILIDNKAVYTHFLCLERLHYFSYMPFFKKAFVFYRGEQCCESPYASDVFFRNSLFSYRKGSKSLLLRGRPVQLLARPINMGRASSDRFGRPLFRAFSYENFTRFLNDVLSHTDFCNTLFDI